MKRLRWRLRVWWKKHTDLYWQWGHPDEWSAEERYDYARARATDRSRHAR